VVVVRDRADDEPHIDHLTQPSQLPSPCRVTFFLRKGWQVQFVESDLKTPLPRKLTFADPEKIRELATRGEAWGDSESRQMLENAIENGRGGIYLKLTPEQHARLKRP
jgi:hypothetical protein